MNQKEVRSDLLTGLSRLEEVRGYVANARLSKAFPNQPNFGPPFDADMDRVEQELHEVVLLLYGGLKEIYTDFEWANSIDGKIPVWNETKD